MENNYDELFNYIFIESYKNLDKIIENEKIVSVLNEQNNSYYQRLCNLNPELDIKIIKAHCFTILYILNIYIMLNN